MSSNFCEMKFLKQQRFESTVEREKILTVWLQLGISMKLLLYNNLSDDNYNYNLLYNYILQHEI